MHSHARPHPQMRRAETADKIKKHRVKRFGGTDDQLEESGEGNKTVRGANSGIMSLGAWFVCVVAVRRGWPNPHLIMNASQSSNHSTVEDKIQLSMIRGEFESLPGKGKPLERERTPGLDRTTDLFMDVLKRNGVLPEWIQRQKRVGAMTGLLRRRLEMELAQQMMEMNADLEKAQGAVMSRHPTREAFVARVGGIRSIEEDLSVINSEIDTYKCVALWDGHIAADIRPTKLNHPTN